VNRWRLAAPSGAITRRWATRRHCREASIVVEVELWADIYQQLPKTRCSKMCTAIFIALSALLAPKNSSLFEDEILISVSNFSALKLP
jgi:hypothetical protein